MGKQDEDKESIIMGAARELRRRWDDGDFDDVAIVKAGSRFASRVSQAQVTTRDAARRARDGYDGKDLWNLGDAILLRMADFADESVCVGSYSALASDVTAGELGDMALAFRAYEESPSLYDSMVHVGSLVEDDGMPVVEKAYGAIEGRFIRAWDDFGAWVFACPVEHDEAAGRGVPMEVLDRLGRRVDASSMEQARIAELRRISNMLLSFAEENFGVPYEYAKKSGGYEHLVRYGKGWKKRGLPLEVTFWGNRDVIDGKKTVKEVGADYVLYVADIVSASESISGWANWLDGVARGREADDSVYPALSVLVGTSDEPVVRQIEDALRADFLAAWHWLGKTSQSLWI